MELLLNISLLSDREGAEAGTGGGGGGQGGQGGLPADLVGGFAGSGGGDLDVGAAAAGGALEVDWKLLRAETSSDMSSLPLPVRLSFSSDTLSTIARKPAMLAMSGMSVFAMFAIFGVLTVVLCFSVIISVVLSGCFSVV